MDEVEVTRNARTNQFSITLVRGSDTIRCMVSVALGDMPDGRSDDEKHRAALSKAKALAQALDAAIESSWCPKALKEKSYYITDDEYRGELSLPDEMDNNHIVSWSSPRAGQPRFPHAQRGMSTDNAAPGYPIFERSVSALAISAFGTSATCNEPQSTSELESKPEISSWTDRASLIGTGLRRGCVVGYLMGEGWAHM